MANVKTDEVTDSTKEKDVDVRIKLAYLIETTLSAFGITARVAEVNNRPKDIEYCLEVALGTTLESITKLNKDIAMAIASPTGDVEIEAPIPGRSLVAVRVPVTQKWIDYQNDYLKDKVLKMPEKDEVESKKPEWTWRQILATGLYLIAAGFGKLGSLVDDKK